MPRVDEMGGHGLIGIKALGFLDQSNARHLGIFDLLGHLLGLFAGDRHPNAERIARRGFYLPSGLALTDEQIERVADGLRRILT